MTDLAQLRDTFSVETPPGAGKARLHKALHDLVQRLSVPTAEPIKRTRRPKPSLVRIKRQAAKADIPVTAYEFRPDGTIIAIVGKPNGEATANEADDDATPEDKMQWN